MLAVLDKKPGMNAATPKLGTKIGMSKLGTILGSQ